MCKLRSIFSLFLLILLDSGVSLLSQEDLKYKDIFNALQSSSKEEIYPLLKAYQGKDPFFANTYYQLGLINEEWARAYDPLTEHEQVEFFIYNTKLFFGLAKHYLDEKQARRYSQFFNKVKPASGKTEPGFKEILDDLSAHLDNILIYQSHTNLSYSFFTRTVSHYNRCVERFMEICGARKMLKEIYLTADDSLLLQTRLLQQDFDSSIYYFNKFRVSLDSFPLKNYNQHYFLKPIETYRLDGLTGSDFTRDTVTFWNYKAWVLDLNRILNTEINSLRNGIDSINIKLDNSLDFFRKNPEWVGTPSMLPQVDPILRNKLNKIDFGSVALNLLTYKENLLAYQALGRDSINSPPDTLRTYSLMQKSRYYHLLVTRKQLIDSLLITFCNSTGKSNIKKYERFFTLNFPSNDSVRKYCNSQKNVIAATINKAVGNFGNYLILDQNKPVVTGILNWKKLPVSSRAIPTGQADPVITDHYLTYVSKTDKSGNLFLAGTYLSAGKRAQAFVAFAEKSKTLNWLKTFDLSQNGAEYYNYILNLELTGNGCFAVVSSLLPGIDSVTVHNTILRLDLKGNELFRQKIHSGSIMRWLSFDDINNKLFAVFQGKKISSSESNPSELCLSSMDSIGNQLWNYQITISGQFSDIVKMDENWLMFCTVSAFQSETKWVTLKDDNDRNARGVISVLVNGSGNLIQTNQYKQSNPSEFARLVKLNSEIINLLAFRNTEKMNPGSSTDNRGKLVYMLLDKKGSAFYLYY